jgi:hypothetical protein
MKISSKLKALTYQVGEICKWVLGNKFFHYVEFVVFAGMLD